MKIKEKIKNYLFKFMRSIIPRTELEKIHDEIDRLKNDPENYGKVAMMYMRLQNIHAMFIGRGGDDNLNFLLSSTYGSMYRKYREWYMIYKSTNINSKNLDI